MAQDSKQNRNSVGIYLKEWHMKSSLLVKDEESALSTGKYSTEGWYKAQVPTTVLNTLIRNGVYPNPRLDLNDYLIPDASDEFNKKHDLAKYSYLPDKKNPWKDPYWFITEFSIPKEETGKVVWLNFNGINYRADVWVNGKKIADSSAMAGMFQRFKYNITDYVNRDGNNYVAVKIYQVDHPGTPNTGVQKEVFGDTRHFSDDIFKDVTLKISGGWDCAPVVRDRNMGIYQDVYISFTNEVDIVNPYIITRLPVPDTTSADITITAQVVNVSGKVQKGLLKGKIDLINEVDFVTYTKKMPGKMESVTFEKEVEVNPGDTVNVTFTSKDFSQLTIKNPYLWWPNGYGQQYLHNLELSYVLDNKVSSKKDVEFGIRELSSNLKEINGEFGRVFYINGKRIFCKGGWLQPDVLLDMDKKRFYDEARLLANANVNLIANEDQPAPREDYMEAADKYGLMQWGIFYQCFTAVPGEVTQHNPLDHNLAIKNSRDILLRYRNNPSLILYAAAVEVTPDEDLYKKLRSSVKELDPSRQFIPATSIWWDWKKLTPYIKDDVPTGTTDDKDPDYTWYPLPFYFDKIREVRWQMFRNELGVPVVPTLSSLKKFIFNLGTDKNNPLFPLDSVWAEHGAWDAGGYAYKAYHNAIKNIYGFNSTDIADYVRTAQFANADSYRAMYEAAMHRMWDITSGVMTWKLNDCWPSVLWQIYDWFLNPNAAYFYMKKACEPVHIQMNANDYRASIINAANRPLNNVKASVKVYDFDLNLKWEKEESFYVSADSYREVFAKPVIEGITPVYFVKLELKDGEGKLLSSNFYWESSKTPTDLSDLKKIKEVKLDLTYNAEKVVNEYHVKVKVKNNTDKISLLNRLAVIKKETGEEVLPTFWDDNYITLMPGEERELEAKFSELDIKDNAFTVIIDNNM
jgi:exo-1,4-beta-D-glucosaminidase